MFTTNPPRPYLPLPSVSFRVARSVTRGTKCLSNAVPAGSTVSSPRWIRTLTLVGKGFLTAGLLAAALPSFLSTRIGLHASLAAVNLMTPGPVEVAELQMGWTRPLVIKGIKIKDKEHTSEGTNSQLLMKMDEINFNDGLWKMAQAAGLLPGYSPEKRSSSSSSSPSLCSPMVIKGAVINCEYDTVSSEFKILEWMDSMSAAGSSKVVHKLDSGHLLDSKRSVKEEKNIMRSQEDSRPAPDAGVPVRSVPATGRVVKMLSQVDTLMGFTADLRVGPSLKVLLPDGLIMVPTDVKNMVGSHLHLTGALGVKPLKQWAEEMQQDMTWAFPVPGQQLLETLPNLTDKNSDLKPIDALPNAQSRLIPLGHEPGIIQVISEHLEGKLKFYKKMGGPILLHEPATVSLEFTPAMSRFGLSLVNPLLSDAIAISNSRSNGHKGDPDTKPVVQLRIAPAHLEMPSEKISVFIEPMNLTLKGGGIIRDLYSALNINFSELSRKKADVQISGMQVCLVRGGPLMTNRVDMSIGSSAGGRGAIELSLWGTHDPHSGALDMIVAVPASMLHQLSLKDLPHDYVLPLPLKGTIDSPELDYRASAAKLAQLVRRQHYLNEQELQLQQEGGNVNKGFLGNVIGVLKNAVIPSAEDVKQIEVEMVNDISSIPKPWTLPAPRLTKPPN